MYVHEKLAKFNFTASLADGSLSYCGTDYLRCTLYKCICMYLYSCIHTLYSTQYRQILEYTAICLGTYTFYLNSGDLLKFCNLIVNFVSNQSQFLPFFKYSSQ